MTQSATATHRRRGVRPRALGDDPLWYKDAIIYEARTRSFFDSNGDGIGDLRGLARKLDYLADLGITALWLLPFYPSPGRDDGYDIADYTGIDADVGTLEDFDELVEHAHRRGIRIITELVLNHTSDQHVWFQRARRAPPGSPERAFYVWSDTPERYTETRIIFRDFEPSNWTWDPIAKAYFWHRFFFHQPDLNYENPAVHEAMFGAVDFWLARGVDGLRLDAVPYLYEAEGTNCENLPQTHAFLKKLRAHVDTRFPARMLLAEANQWPEDAAAYFGNGDECHMNFHFPIMPRLFMAMHMEDRFPIIDILRQTPEPVESCQWAMFLRNHDELTLEMVTDEERDYMYRAYAYEGQMRINLGIRRRLAPLAGNDRRKMELLNGLLFSMPGTPVLYYGDEIGMGDNIYLGDRNGVRTPMQWSADRNAGFSRANPQRLILPINIDPEYHYEAINVEAQQSNPNSLLWWTKRLIALRGRFRAFGRGAIEFLHPNNPKVLAFIRRYEDELILVVANLSRHVQYVELELGALRGMQPRELVGRTRFPPIGELPYMLTLGGHDFFWFSIEPPSAALLNEERLSQLEPPAILASSIEDLLFGGERPLLEDVLPPFLEALGWPRPNLSQVRVREAVRLGDEPLMALLFLHLEYTEGEPEDFMLPVAVELDVGSAPSGPAIAQLHLHQPSASSSSAWLIEANCQAVSRRFLQALADGATFPASVGRVVAEPLPGTRFSLPAETHLVSTNRLGAAVAFGEETVLKLFHKMEEGMAPEVEVGRDFHQRGVAGLTPALLGAIEYRAPRAEPVTVALLEQYVVHEGSAWDHARSEVGRAYERVLAQPAGAAPQVPHQPLVELAAVEPPPEHNIMVGSYRDWAFRLGGRTAELHEAMAASPQPAFEPHVYSAMDLRSKYQNARNVIGRVLAWLRRSLSVLDAPAQVAASQLLANEAGILARLEPLLSLRLDARQIRYHGDLHLGRVLFTGKDFVILGVGGGRDRRLSERRRKRSAMHDVAGMVRSFDYAMATAIRALRAEDQQRAEPWGWTWQRWAAAAYLRGYLAAAADAVFVPKERAALSLMLETSILEKAFFELRNELSRRPEMAWIPLQGILRLINAPVTV